MDSVEAREIESVEAALDDIYAESASTVFKKLLKLVDEEERLIGESNRCALCLGCLCFCCCKLSPRMKQRLQQTRNERQLSKVKILHKLIPLVQQHAAYLLLIQASKRKSSDLLFDEETFDVSSGEDLFQWSKITLKTKLLRKIFKDDALEHFKEQNIDVFLNLGKQKVQLHSPVNDAYSLYNAIHDVDVNKTKTRNVPEPPKAFSRA